MPDNYTIFNTMLYLVSQLTAMSALSLYHDIVEHIKSTIKQSQYTAYRTVNTQLIDMYFQIGKIIAEQMENNGRGKSVVETLSIDLKKEFGDRAGYSVQNLWYMKKLYVIYHSDPKLQQLVGQLPRGQHIAIVYTLQDL